MTDAHGAHTHPAGQGFTLPGWGVEPAAQSPRRRKARARLLTSASALPLYVFALLALVGGGLLYLGQASAGQAIAAPVPPVDFVVPADAPVVGPDGTESVVLAGSDAGMTVDSMAASTYFIPALGVYSEIVATEEFVPSRYADLDTITIPTDPTKSVWYAGGGALSGNGPGTAGTTFLASHVSYNGQWGVLRYLYTLRGGEFVYVKDADGGLSAWKVTELYIADHTAFPQDYWSADGPRRLVVTTCGQYDSATQHYKKNIFAVAVPVDAATGNPLTP